MLKGQIQRGDGRNVHAVIWFCDLRSSTPLANSMSREAFLALLNDYFKCMAGAVLDGDGEVLRFIGAAANEAARIESMCKTLCVSVLASDRVIQHLNGGWHSTGAQELRGVSDKIEVFMSD